MNFLNVSFDVQNLPVLDKGFIPLEAFSRAFLKLAKKPIAIAVGRNGGLVSVYNTFVCGTSEMREADLYYVDRTVKFLLWQKGGYEVFLCGDDALAAAMAERYRPGGARAFDAQFMSNIFEKPFRVTPLPLGEKPAEKESPNAAGRNLDGCRIGFDAGGSDRKVSAVIDGEPVYSEEVIWFPKTNADPDYHFQGIVAALKAAAAKMPRVDAIGISSAGVYIDNRTMAASLFLKVPPDLFEQKVKDIYLRAAKEIGDVPVVVANDGDVTALAGAMSLDDTRVLGIAMGTSEAAGYVDRDGNITGWLNELAFAPVDGQPDAMTDEWSGDIGCGVNYFSQDGVIKLAPRCGISLKEGLSPAEKLKIVQKEMDAGNPAAFQIYETIGCYLGHTAAYYARFYDIKYILLLGRVTSGEGGNILLEEANRVLSLEYPEVAQALTLQLPDEKGRRVGQSVAAASLPKRSPRP